MYTNFSRTEIIRPFQLRVILLVMRMIVLMLSSNMEDLKCQSLVSQHPKHVARCYFKVSGDDTALKSWATHSLVTESDAIGGWKSTKLSLHGTELTKLPLWRRTDIISYPIAWKVHSMKGTYLKFPYLSHYFHVIMSRLPLILDSTANTRFWVESFCPARVLIRLSTNLWYCFAYKWF